MKTSVLIRSVNGRSDTAFIRPDSVDLLINQEISKDDFTSKWYHLFDKCISNLNMGFPFCNPNAEVWIANHERGICEAYRHESNHELRDGTLVYEDGRSLRYVVHTDGWYVGISHDATDFSRIIRFSVVGDFIITEQLFRLSVNKSVVTFILAVVHGKYNYGSTKTYQEQVRCNKLHIESLRTILNDKFEKYKTWKNDNVDRDFAIIFGRDNRFRVDVFNYFEFFKTMGCWNVPSPYAILCDPRVDPGWWILCGWRTSNSKVLVDLHVGQSGDTSPVLFTIEVPGDRITGYREKILNKEFFTSRRFIEDIRFKTSDGNFLNFTEIEQHSYVENKRKRKKVKQQRLLNAVGGMEKLMVTRFIPIV